MAESCEINEFHLFRRHHLSPGYLKGWRIFILGPKIPSELVFKAVKNRKCSGYVDCQQVRLIDQNLFFSKSTLLILIRWWQQWMKSTAIKQRYWMNIFFVVFCSIDLLPNSMSKLIHSWCKLTCKLLNKIMTDYVNEKEQLLGPCFLCFSPLFSVVQLWNN